MGVAVSVQPGPTHMPRRVGDEERHTCADQLAVHHAAGRLSTEEFEERLGIALTAQTAGELGRILTDLPFPETAPSGPPPPPSILTPPLAWVGGGVLLLVASWALIFLVWDQNDGGAAALGAITSLLGVLATLLVVRGVRRGRPGSRQG